MRPASPWRLVADYSPWRFVADYAPWRLVADYALPPRCPGCGAIVGEDRRFCSACWSGLRFLGPPACAGCGSPFDVDRGVGARCGACIADPPRHAGVRAAVAYGPVARRVVLRLKYGGRTGLAALIADLLARAMPADAEFIVPVPLHPRRLWTRGYNQAALLATELARRSGVPSDAHALTRRKSTPVLRGLDARARAQAVRGAFAVAAPGQVAGRRLVLVDDVHTSGATADACTAALLGAGAASVTILCWARVIDGAGGWEPGD